jgi:hypothetical protein
VKLAHLVGFFKKKFVTMHGHMNVKFILLFSGHTRTFLEAYASFQIISMPSVTNNALFSKAIDIDRLIKNLPVLTSLHMAYRCDTQIKREKLQSIISVLGTNLIYYAKCFEFNQKPLSGITKIL